MREKQDGDGLQVSTFRCDIEWCSALLRCEISLKRHEEEENEVGGGEMESKRETRRRVGASAQEFASMLSLQNGMLTYSGPNFNKAFNHQVVVLESCSVNRSLSEGVLSVDVRSSLQSSNTSSSIWKHA